MDQDTSEADYGQVITPVIVGQDQSWCVSFWYNMKGDHMGSLSFGSMTLGQELERNDAWFLEGNQGEGWQEGRFGVDFQSGSNYRLVFRGTLGAESSDDSDIAVDDIKVTDGSCSGKHNWETKCCKI